MDENDQYAGRQSSAFGPIGFVLVVALVAIFGIVVYAASPEGGDIARALDRGLIPSDAAPR